MQMRNKFYLSKGQTTMRLFAFAALLALPLLGLGAQSASADSYCCGKGRYGSEHTVRWTYLTKDATVFDCDAYFCETKIKVYSGTKVKVYCRNGWCHIKNFPFANVWVLEECLSRSYDKGYRQDNGYDLGSYENGNGDKGYEGENGGGYKRYEGENGNGYKRDHYNKY